MPFLSDAEFAAYQQWKSGGQQPAQIAPSGTSQAPAVQQPVQQQSARAQAMQQATAGALTGMGAALAPRRAAPAPVDPAQPTSPPAPVNNEARRNAMLGAIGSAY